MAPSKLEFLLAVTTLFAASIMCISCSKDEEDPSGKVALQSFGLDSPGALQAAKRLSTESRNLLGSWQLSVSGGNHLFYEIPQEIQLLPYGNPPSQRPKYFVLQPKLPQDHIFHGDTYWTLNDRGELILWWIKFSGIRATLHAINEDRWEGIIEEVWESSKESVGKSVVIER
jgi:hypothetical protein